MEIKKIIEGEIQYSKKEMIKMSSQICERIACNKKPSWVLKFKDGEKEYYCNSHKPLTIKSYGTENLRR